MSLSESTIKAFELFEYMQTDHPDSPFTWENISLLDAKEEFPELACRGLNEYGLHHYYVPITANGKLSNYQDILWQWRAVASRDLTIAVAHGKTFLGSICVWLAGNTQQIQHLSTKVMQGAVVSWGLTERAHGSDLLAGELSASQIDKSWQLNGEKWLINNCTRGQMICLLARTHHTGGTRGFSLFLVDKQNLAHSSFRYLPKELTHGIRGADISGIALCDAIVPETALIGNCGHGIEIVLKALQITRTLCAGLSLGAADQALHLTLEFAKQHFIYKHYLIELPLARHSLKDAFSALIICEVVATIATRSIQALPSEMSIISAIAKAFIPTLIDESITQLGELLGARSFLLEEYKHGIFQKLERDHRIVAIFDGSTVVNRNALINQFRSLARHYRLGKYNKQGLYQACNAQAELPNLDVSALSLLSTQGLSVMQSLSPLMPQLAAMAARNEIPLELVFLANEFLEIIETVQNELEQVGCLSREVPFDAFSLAIRYEYCFAGAACLQWWIHNAKTMNNALWQNGLWLQASLAFILCKLGKNTSFQITEKLLPILIQQAETYPFSFGISRN